MGTRNAATAKKATAKKATAKKATAKKATAKKATAKKATAKKRVRGAAVDPLSSFVDQLVSALDFPRGLVEGLVEHLPPITAAEVRLAERQLGECLPGSYVDHVTTHGTFRIDGSIYGKGSGNDIVLFTPSEIAERTNRYRAELDPSRDAESQAILRDGLLFCGAPDREYFFLFVSSSRTKAGEMMVHDYDYSDPANSTRWMPSRADEPFDRWLRAHLEHALAELDLNLDDVIEELSSR